ncbi:MAG: hypothetical protein ACFFG0_56060 [Candidatus Thorarchaeota archaeon]
MIFQNGIGEPPSIFIAIPLMVGSFLLFAIGIYAAKAQEKTNLKWILGSFFIQFGVIFFVSSPLLLYGMTGQFNGDPRLIIPVVILSIFIVINMVNVIHKIGLKRSFIVVFLFVLPMVGAITIIGLNLGGA